MCEYLRKLFFRYWRILSLIGIIVGMQLSWHTCHTDVMGLEPAEWPGGNGWWQIKDNLYCLRYSRNDVIDFLDYGLFHITELLGACSLLLYFLGTFYMIVGRPTKTSNGWLFFLRVTSFFSALILLSDFIEPIIECPTSIGYHISAITIFGSFLLEGNESMNLNAKYPYLTAWTGVIALNALIAVPLFFVYPDIIRLIIQFIIGFFIFKFVIKRNLLPYMAKDDTKS